MPATTSSPRSPGAGNDTLTGGLGDDHLCGDAGTDHWAGGGGNDLCNGGTPGTDENRYNDPDLCADDAETHVSCYEVLKRGDSGTASGTCSYEGITETWSAKVDVPYVGADYYYDPAATTYAWSLDGQDKYGCTFHADSTTFSGPAQVGIDPDAGTYSIQIWSGSWATVPVTINCPVTVTQIENWNPLNGAVTNAKDYSLVDGYELAGTQTVTMPDDPYPVVSWQWDVEQYASGSPVRLTRGRFPSR